MADRDHGDTGRWRAGGQSLCHVSGTVPGSGSTDRWPFHGSPSRIGGVTDRSRVPVGLLGVRMIPAGSV